MKLKGISDQGFSRLAQAMDGRDLIDTNKLEDECPCKKMLREEFDIDMDEFEDELEGGKGDKAMPSDFPLEQVRMGIKVEMEHTDDPYLALEIALDHLTEFEDYYTGLDEMEKELEEPNSR